MERVTRVIEPCRLSSNRQTHAPIAGARLRIDEGQGLLEPLFGELIEGHQPDERHGDHGCGDRPREHWTDVSRPTQKFHDQQISDGKGEDERSWVDALAAQERDQDIEDDRRQQQHESDALATPHPYDDRDHDNGPEDEQRRKRGQ